MDSLNEHNMDSLNDRSPDQTDDNKPSKSMTCTNSGCGFSTTEDDELISHGTVCEYRMTPCGFCGTKIRYKDMSAHRAVKRCYEAAQRRRMVQSAKGTKTELIKHRQSITHQRHTSEQAERKITKEFHERENLWEQKMPLSALARRRVQSAGALLIGDTAAQVRMLSARTPRTHYDSSGYLRNLRSAIPSMYRTPYFVSYGNK